MQARNCRERVLNLKAWRMRTGKTIAECVELCGDYPSDKTVEKVFLKGSEEKSFRESTIAAIELACLGKVYEPEARMPIEDVTRSIETAVKPYAAEIRLLRYTVEQQEQIINGLVRLGVLAVLLMLSIGIYDTINPGVGFWGSHLYWVSILKFIFVAFAVVIIVRRVYALHKLKLHFRAEIKQQEQDA